MKDAGPAGLWNVVREIPVGSVAGYGDVGRALNPPVSGLLVGRWIARCPEDVPWWRVVGKDGTLLLAKRDPEAAVEQATRLRREGVLVEGGRADMAQHGYIP